MRKYIAEYHGTFAIVFFGTGAIVINQLTGAITHSGIALSFGLVVMAMIYAFGSISGAHFNPAVTIAFAAAKKFPVKEVLPYVISQLAGALSASMMLRFLFPDSKTLGETVPSGSEMQSLILEFILTFFLMIVILRVAHGSKEEGMFAGLAIGAVVLLEALVAGPVCGASMNPVRSIAPAVVGGNMHHLWIYIVAPIAGAMAAVPLFNYFKK